MPAFAMIVETLTGSWAPTQITVRITHAAEFIYDYADMSRGEHYPACNRLDSHPSMCVLWLTGSVMLVTTTCCDSDAEGGACHHCEFWSVTWSKLTGWDELDTPDIFGGLTKAGIAFNAINSKSISGH